MAQIPNFTPSVPTGAGPTYGNAAAGDTISIGRTLLVKNANGSSITVTLATPGNLVTGDAFPDKAYTVADTAEAWIPILPAYADPTDGLAHITWSATSGVTRASVPR